MTAHRKITWQDATPEWLQRYAGETDLIEAPRMPGEMGRLSKARRRTPTLDRWHNAKLITQRQWGAGCVYRETHERCMAEPRVVGNYGGGVGGGVHPGTFGYGLPHARFAAEARALMRDMRKAVGLEHQAMLDRLVIHDRLPRYTGRRHRSILAVAGKALDELAQYLAL